MNPSLPTPHRRSLVIVVDDDAAVRSSLMFSLNIEGFAVQACADARELLDSADLPSCSCLIIDQRLPGMTGLELLALLRNRNIGTPAILITTHPDALVRRAAQEARVPIVEKPFLENTLLDQLRKAIATDNGSGTTS